MSVEFLVPARWLTVSGTAVNTRTYKIDPGFPAITILASPFTSATSPGIQGQNYNVDLESMEALE